MTTRAKAEGAAAAGLAFVRESPGHDGFTVRGFSVREGTLNVEERSVEAVIATEAPVAVYDWLNGRVIDEVLLMSGAQIPASRQVPLLDAHSRWSTSTVVGSTRDIHVEGEQLIGRNHISETAPAQWTLIREGHLTDNSVGYRTLEYQDIRPGESATVAGRTFTAGQRVLRVTTRWEIKENSLVPIGADDLAKMRHGSNQPELTGRNGGAIMPTFEQWLSARGLAIKDLTPERQTELRAVYRREHPDAAPGNPPPEPGGQRNDPPAPAPPVPAPSPAPPPDAAAVLQAERARIAMIRERAGTDIEQALVNRAIDEGWDEARVSREFLANLRGQRGEPVPVGVPAIHSRDRDRDCTAERLGWGLTARMGINPIRQGDRPDRRREIEQAVDVGARYANQSLVDFCRDAIRLDGRVVPHGRDDIIMRALSGGALSKIFTTVVNAAVMQSYEQAEDSTVGLCREVDVADFNTQERMRLLNMGQMKRKAKGTPAPHVAPEDVGEEYKIARYTNQFVLDEEDIICDRFNVLQDVPQMMGRAARRLRPDLVFAIILANANLSDGLALFEGTVHKNYGTSGSALAAPAVQTALAAMANQRENGVPLNINASLLYTPPDLYFAAKVILQSVERIIAAASGGTLNPLLAENIQPRREPRLGAIGVTDPASGKTYTGSGTNWLLAASPTQAPTIEVGYLSGTGRVPVIRSFVLDRGEWGIGWDCKLDIGAKALDYRGLYFATGAS